MSFFTNLWAGRDKEEDILSIVKKYFENSFIYENRIPGWGEDQINQDYEYNGKKYICPDIVTVGSDGVIILRIEVKGIERLETWKNELVVKMERRLFEKYLSLQREEEIPCTVIFSVGIAHGGNYEYYWKTLNEMSSLPKKYEYDEQYVSKKGNLKECVYWRISDFNKGIRSFTNHLEEIRDGW